MRFTRLSSNAVRIATATLGFVFLACRPVEEPPDAVVYSEGVAAQVPDSVVDMLASAADTTAMAFIKFNSELLQSIEANVSEVRSVSFEMGSVGLLNLTLSRDSSTAIEGAEVWSFVDTADASTRVMLVRVDSAFSGQVWKQGELFRIEEVLGDSVYLIRRPNRGTFRPEGRPRIPRSSGRGSIPPAASADVTNCAPVVVDVLVGVPAGDTLSLGGLSQVRAEVGLAVVATNRALLASMVPHLVRLVGVLVTGGSGSGTLGADLTRLEDPEDGMFDDLLNEREQRRADFVGLWLAPPTDYCGLANLTRDFRNSSSALFAVASDCANDNMSFPHELGHIFGIEHDRSNADQAPFVSYAFGYQQASGKARDIMSYNCPGGCDRAPMYSNVSRQWKGEAIGVAASDLIRGADAASALKVSACHVSRFRR